MSEFLPLIIFSAVIFFGGYGWGQYIAERRLKAERRGMLLVTMPMKPEMAKDTMRLLTSIIERVAREQQQCEYCDGTGDIHRADGEWLGSCHCQQQAEVKV